MKMTHKRKTVYNLKSHSYEFILRRKSHSMETRVCTSNSARTISYRYENKICFLKFYFRLF